MEGVRSFPFLKLVCSLSLGIFLGAKVSFWGGACVLCVLGIMSVLGMCRDGAYRGEWRSALLLIAFMTVGWGAMLVETRAGAHQLDIDNNRSSRMAIVVDDFPHTGKTIRCRGRLVAIDTHRLDKPERIEVQSRQVEWQDLRPLDTVVFEGYLKPTASSDAPYQFDYAAYLANENIYYTAWSNEIIANIKHGDYVSWIDKVRYGLRSRFIKTLKAHLSPLSYQLSAAILLGYRYDMGRDMRDIFARSGAIHIMAVSGLHVGILLWIINCIMGLFSGRTMQIGGGVNFVVVVLILLLYALLTGMAPPVVRASSLAILYWLGRLFLKPLSSINILSATALLMLLYDPSFLFDLSFQMSFAAVASIIIFFPSLAKWYQGDRPYIRYVWKMIAASIAAQILIFPISIYYFHQFPMYALWSSIVGIFAAGLIIGLGGILLIFGCIEVVKELGFLCLDLVCQALLGINHFISDLPGAVIDGIWITQLEAFLLFFAMCILALAYQLGRLYYWYMGLGIILMVVMLNTVLLWRARHQTVLRLGDQQSELILGSKGYILCPEANCQSFYYEDDMTDYYHLISLKYLNRHEVRDLIKLTSDAQE